MRESFSASIAKDLEDEHLNEDATASRPAHGLYAVSDGASESFGSARWARILVRFFLRSQQIDETWLRRAIGSYNALFDRNAMSWSGQAAFDRGSFATLTGVVLYLVAHLLAAHAKKSGLPEEELKRISDAANATLTVVPFLGGTWSVDRITQAAQNEIDGVMGLTQALMRPKRSHRVDGFKRRYGGEPVMTRER